LAARQLEQNGIATVVIGSALDIVQTAQAPRYFHNDIPLGNPLGHPFNSAEQLATVTQALSMIDDPASPRLKMSDLRWHQGEQWRENYMRVDETNKEALKLAGEENRKQRKENALNGVKRD